MELDQNKKAEQGGAARSFYEKGPVRIHYEEAGSRLPAVAHRGRGIELDDVPLDQRSLQPDRGIQGRRPASA